MAWLIGILVFPLATPADAQSYPLVPQTRLRLTVVQWVPMRGEYQKWDALGGELVISPEGTIALPVVGSVSVGDLSDTELAAEIAKRIQEKIGLVGLPETTLEIIEYPPIYVVGQVTAPGEYRFRPGLTVLQALALGGGQLRPEGQGGQDSIRLVGDLQMLESDILRSLARIARLQAEMSGAEAIEFPPELTEASANGALAGEIMAREEIIFSARRNGISRQSQSLSELSELFNAEIGVLQEKVKDVEQGLETAEQELTGVKGLVEQGIATISRRSDLERALAALRADRLDNITATMRARQNLSEATRNLAQLEDERRTTVATELQAEEANLEQLRMKQSTSRQLLLAVDEAAQESQLQRELVFTLIRQEQGQTAQVAADEETMLMPGDVVKVAVTLVEGSQEVGAAQPSREVSAPWPEVAQSAAR